MLQNSRPSLIKHCKFIFSDSWLASIPYCVKLVVLKLIGDQIDRFRFRHTANLCHKLLSVLFLCIWLLQKRNFWGIVESCKLLTTSFRS